MKRVLFIIVVMSVVFPGCNNRERTQNAREILTIPQSVDTSFFKNVSGYELIRLEATNASSLLSHISKIRVFKDEIFILDIRQNKLVVFSKDGKFLRSIGRIGRGPGEYIRLTGFEIDHRTNELLLLDKSEGKALIYSMDGTFKKHVSFENLSLNIARLGNGNFVLAYGVGLFQQNDNYVLAICDPQGRVISRHIRNEFSLPIAFNANMLMSMPDGSVCFLPQFNNVLYSISGDEAVTPVLGFELPSGLVGIDDIVGLGITNDDKPFMDLLKKKDHLRGEMAANRQYVCVENNIFSSPEWIVYNTQTKSVKRLQNPLLGYTMYIDDNNGFWAAVRGYEVKKLGASWDEDENPPIIHYTLTDF
jgi:hypothetical protein